MEENNKQKNTDEKVSKPRPPYTWDDRLKEITEKAKQVIEKEETNAEDDRK